MAARRGDAGFVLGNGKDIDPPAKRLPAKFPDRRLRHRSDRRHHRGGVNIGMSVAQGEIELMTKQVDNLSLITRHVLDSSGELVRHAREFQFNDGVYLEIRRMNGR